MAQVVCFDIDGVLTEDNDTKHGDLSGTYTYRKPRQRAIQLCNLAYRHGFYVLLFTGRKEPQRRITEDWLHERGILYHNLIMGKPYYTFFIEDRMIGATVDQQLDALESIINGS